MGGRDRSCIRAVEEFIHVVSDHDAPAILLKFCAAISKLEELLPGDHLAPEALTACARQLMWNRAALPWVKGMLKRWCDIAPAKPESLHLKLAQGITAFYEGESAASLAFLIRARFLADRHFDDEFSGIARYYLARCDLEVGKLDQALAYARYSKLLLRDAGFAGSAAAAEELEAEILRTRIEPPCADASSA